MAVAIVNDLYAALGVDKTATLEEIRSAYHQLALKHHPDRNQGSTESEDRFRAISSAYNVLSDDRQRRQYDREMARPAPRPAPGGSYTAPAPQGEEGWSQARKYEAVKNSYFYKQGERRRAQNEQHTPSPSMGPSMGSNPVFSFSAPDDLPGTGIQAPIELGVQVPIVMRRVPGLGGWVRVVEGPFGTLPGFGVFRRPL